MTPETMNEISTLIREHDAAVEDITIHGNDPEGREDLRIISKMVEAGEIEGEFTYFDGAIVFIHKVERPSIAIGWQNAATSWFDADIWEV